MNTFMPALYINEKISEPYSLLEDGTVFKDESDTSSLYYIAKNIWCQKTWLSFRKSPFMVWSGCHGNITPLENFKPSDQFLALIRIKGLHIYLYEPLSTYRKGVKNRFTDHKFYDQYESTYINIMSARSYELDSIHQFAEKYELHTITVYTCEYNVSKIYKDKYPYLTVRCQDIFLAADCISKNVEQPYKTKLHHKKFWCGNWRYNGVRHLVMMYLASTDNFYNGNYSWYVYGGQGYVSGKLWFDLSSWKKTHPDMAAKIEKGEKILSEVVPLAMDIEEPPMWFVGDDVSKNPPSVKSYRLPLQYAECFVAIVNESRFAQPTGNFSEKLLNTVRAFKPFVLFGPPKTLTYFRALGFHTFGDFWDESYDDELDHQARLIKLFKVIDYIDSLSLYETRDIYEQMKPILEHNAKVLPRLALEGTAFD